MHDIATRLAETRRRIAEAERRYGRASGSVTLIAVSKTHGVEKIAAARAAGQIDFGESYLQEALPKIEALAGRGIVWHFIGALQANKTRAVAAHFDWVHSVDRLKLAQRLSEQRPGHLPPLDVCLQVNAGDEPQKAGVGFDELPALARAVAVLPRLRLRGLMCIPPASDAETEQRKYFHRLYTAYAALTAQGLPLDTLSMGMSGDFEAAIAEGATMVRLGTAIFGERER